MIQISAPGVVARGQGRLLALLGSAWLIGVGGACTTPASMSGRSTDSPESAAPKATAQIEHSAMASRTSKGPGSPASDEVADRSHTATIPLLDRAPRRRESLAFARAVLEHKGSRKLDARQREAVAGALVRAQAEHGLSVILSLALIELESGFDPKARGPAGSIGLMQLQPATASDLASRAGLGWKNHRTLLDPEKNARLGLAYLAEMRRQFGTTERAVAAYNIGPTKLRRLLAKRPLRPGPYLTKVYAHVNALRAEYGE
jgi:Transglycosylase SLT domain